MQGYSGWHKLEIIEIQVSLAIRKSFSIPRKRFVSQNGVKRRSNDHY